MNRRILLLAAVIVVAGAIGWQITNENYSEVGAAYTPRSADHSANSAQGGIEYQQMVKANVLTGEYEAESELRVRKALERLDRQGAQKNDDISWMSMGPDNVGGRSRAVLAFPDDPNTLIAGGTSSGLFKSTNAGENWQRLEGWTHNVVISSIAMLGNGVIYCGTGSSFGNFPTGGGGSNFIGGGLFMSADEGETWELVSDFEPDLWNNDDDWAIVNVLIPDPNDPEKLWIGNNNGFYSYTHGNDDLDPLPTGLIPTFAQDAAMSTDGENIIVSLGVRTYVSTDFGQSFEQVNEAPFTTGANTIRLAVAPYDKDLMFASVANSVGALKGIFATRNAGESWTVAAPDDQGGTGQFSPFNNGLTNQGWIHNMLTMSPQVIDGNEEVIMGGIRIYKYKNTEGDTPGISLWELINANFASAPGLPPSPLYVHSDILDAEWDINDNLYVATDGGIFKSTDYGGSWIDANRNYVTTDYYSIAFNPNGQVLGGLQDNGTLWLSLQGATPGEAVQFTGGDGFDSEISQHFPDFMFSTIYNGAVFRSADGGNTITPMGNLASVSSGGGNDFTTNITLHENARNEFSEQLVEYSPAMDDQYLEFLPEPEVTSDGDSIIARIPAGTEVFITADNSDYQIGKVLDEDLNFYSYFVRFDDNGNELIFNDIADTTTIRELPQFMMAAALSNGTYITRQPLKTNGEPQWFEFADPESGSPTSMQFSPDGNHLYVGYSSGRLYRYSGFNDAWTELELDPDEDEYALTNTLILTASGPVMDIEVDYSQGQGTIEGEPAASERVAVAIGGYGGDEKVFVSDNAASAEGVGSFENIWDIPEEVAGMPAYSIVMDINDPETFLVGTEFGIWYSGDNGNTWTEANGGQMSRVPVYDLRQQKRRPWNAENSGVVYVGTFGRGVFRSDYLLDPLSTNEDLYASNEVLSDLNIFPNPMTGSGTIEFDLNQENEVSVFIFSLDGRMVKAIKNQRVDMGNRRQVRFNASDLAAGTYVVQVKAGEALKTSKFVKSN